MGKKRDYFRRYHARRYETHAFRNPYHASKQERTSRLTWVGISLGAITFLSVIVYLFGFAPYWMITEVRVEGLQFMSAGDITTTAEAQLNKRRAVFFPERNRLFFQKDALTSALNKQFSFETLNLDISRHILTLVIKERVSEVLWKSGSTYFFVDTSGTVIRPVPDNDASWLVWHGSTQPLVNNEPVEGPFPKLLYLTKLPLLIDQDQQMLKPGDRVLVKDGITNLLAFDKMARENSLGVSQYLVEHPDAVWVRAVTQEGFAVLVDLTQDIQQQVNNMLNVLQYDVQDRTRLQYIDVRFGNHVYYKTNEN